MTDLMDTVLDISELQRSQLPDDALLSARLSLFDWLICGLSGVGEPLAEHLRSLAAHEKGSTTASVFGADKVPARMAALVNGATSHALDFDDTHFAHVGHLAVGIYPAALAVGEETDASADDVAAAFLVGAEAAIRIGMVLGDAHYNKGFHQTATAGAFGATVAAGRLYGLTRDQMRMGLGLCATRASGLKSQFGTMGKPYNAGLAAANGVECALLAKTGMTSCTDGLMGAQGFVTTHSDAAEADIAPVGQFLFGDVSYKFHACCHGTHAMIEAILALRTDHNIAVRDISTLSLSTNPRWLSVCDIALPATGLEIKFSYRWLACMALDGIDTGAFASYSDTLAADPAIACFALKVHVAGDPTVGDMQAKGTVILKDGRTLEFTHDLAQKIAPEELQARLKAKAKTLLGDNVRAVQPVLEQCSDMTAADLGLMIRGKV